jgi:ferredoxin
MSGRVRIDADLCIGAGNCCRIAPWLFELNEDEVAVVLDPTNAGPEAAEAERSCPTGAVVVDETDRQA